MAYIPEDARWYLADLVIEHQIEGDPRNVVHTNTYLIEASSPEQAYEKAIKFGKDSEQTYQNTDGRKVVVLFRGLSELNVIHEELADGVEIAYSESVGVSEAELAASIATKEQLGVFRPRTPGVQRGVPNLMPEEVMQKLENEGFVRQEVDGRRDA